MAIVACLLLLLSCSIAGHASPTSSLATGWHDEQVDRKATDRVWLYDNTSKTSSAIRSTAEQDEVLVKRASSSSPSHRHWSPHLDIAGLRQATTSTLRKPPVIGSDHSRWPGLGTVAPSQALQDRPSADHTVGESTGKRPYKANRRSPGSPAK